MSDSAIQTAALHQRLGNALLHALHVGIIVFTLIGWLWCGTRAAHLALLGLIAASWVLLAPFKGFGYCLITDIQWRMRARMGIDVPEGGYMRFLCNNLLGRDIDDARMDAITYSVTLVCCAGSIALSLRPGGFC
ncbi:MAG TPA: DUF2784 family protein [Myxococcota bacterium]|nr:DUF2784 family protein [Myxococcota bacterium]